MFVAEMISFIWGLISLFFMVIALIPCFGSINWFNIPFSVFGLIYGVLILIAKKNDKEKDLRMINLGMIFCGIAILVGSLRLVLGLGIF